jgi:hypothetical protein
MDVKAARAAFTEASFALDPPEPALSRWTGGFRAKFSGSRKKFRLPRRSWILPTFWAAPGREQVMAVRGLKIQQVIIDKMTSGPLHIFPPPTLRLLTITVSIL